MGKLIIGNNIYIDKSVTDIAVINKEGEYTSDDEGKIFLGETVYIDSGGVLNGTISPNTGSHTTNFATIAGRKIYFCDCTAGNITVTLNGALNEYVFVKTDASPNTVILDPSTNINGAGTYTLTSQYQKVTVVYDGTNFYV